MEYEQIKKELAGMKSEMTSVERMNAYLKGEEVDHLPYNLMDVELPLAEILGYTTLQLNNDFDVFAEVVKQKELMLGIKGVSVGLDLRSIGRALGTTLQFPERGIPCIKDHILKDYKDFDKLEEFDPYKNEFLKGKLEFAKRLKDKFPDLPISTSTNGPLSVAQSIRPVEFILKDMRKNKENLHKLIEISLECCIKWVEAFSKEFGSVSFSFGDPVASGALIGKKMYDEYAFPYEERLVNAVYEITGNKPVCHICGKSNHLWEDIGKLNISGYSVDNVEDIEELKKALGDKMLIIGNIAPVEVMNLGSVDDVIEAVKSCIIKAADSPNGYLIHTGCDVPIKTPLCNMEAYIYAVKKFGRNAKIGRLPEGIKEFV